MNFNNKLPEWKNSGTEQSDSLKNDGFKAGYKPSANVFNWFWSLVSKCITEIQSKLSSEETHSFKNKSKICICTIKASTFLEKVVK